MIRYTRGLLTQGRNKTVAEWIACIPETTTAANPWLWYWSGMCSFPIDLLHARTCLEQALPLFEKNTDIPGVYLSWAGIVDCYVFADEWASLDTCIARFDELRIAYPDFPSTEIELIASAKLLLSLTLRKLDQPELVQGWLERVSNLLQENPSFDIQMDTFFCMSVHYLWKGEYQKNAILLERAEAEIRHRRSSPFARIRIKLMQGIHAWISAEDETALPMPTRHGQSTMWLKK